VRTGGDYVLVAIGIGIGIGIGIVAQIFLNN